MMSDDPLQDVVNILTTEQLDAIEAARARAVMEWRQRAEAAEAKLKVWEEAVNSKDPYITNGGYVEVEVLEAVKRRNAELLARAEEATAKLALVDTFAEWKRNAPHGSLTFEQWLAGREAAGYPTITARIGQTIIRPEFPVDPADYE